MKFEKLTEYANRCKELNKPMQLLVEMPGFPSPEMIVNPPENIDGKLAYYAETYDENCEHKHVKGIAIVDVVETMDVGQALLPFTGIADGHVRYSGATYIGDASEDLTIEGAPDDVIAVLEAASKLR